MELATIEDALVANFLTSILLSWFYHSAFRKPERTTDERRKRRFSPRFNPDTGEWEVWDGTPIGAIEDMLMDTDGDGDWDDFDGDGLPDD